MYDMIEVGSGVTVGGCVCHAIVGGLSVGTVGGCVACTATVGAALGYVQIRLCVGAGEDKRVETISWCLSFFVVVAFLVVAFLSFSNSFVSCCQVMPHNVFVVCLSLLPSLSVCRSDQLSNCMPLVSILTHQS